VAEVAAEVAALLARASLAVAFLPDSAGWEVWVEEAEEVVAEGVVTRDSLSICECKPIGPQFI